MIKLDCAGIKPFLENDKWKNPAQMTAIAETLVSQYGPDSEMRTWMNLPETYDRAEFDRIKSAAAQITAESDALLVIGIGGSFLGAKAAIDLLRSPHYNLMTKSTPNIYFVGNNFSAAHVNEVKALLRNKNFSINVISKSGGTLEPALSFRIFKEMLENQYGDLGARKRIFVTTDRRKGTLREWAEKEGFATFTIPERIGGRYSVLSAVGLLPMAVAGIHIDRVMTGAFEAMKTYTEDMSFANPTWQYAAIRQALYRKGKTIEVLACYEPAFRYMGEWWKQLYGESEGKAGGGIFPASVDLSADLHSMGQYLQEGARHLMETVVSFGTFRQDVRIPDMKEDLDHLNFLSGKSLESINETAKRATNAAHISGGVPLMELCVPELSEESFGWLVYFFQFACALSGFIQGVNPFDQPGVEVYKKNMFRMLGRPEA